MYPRGSLSLTLGSTSDAPLNPSLPTHTGVLASQAAVWTGHLGEAGRASTFSDPPDPPGIWLCLSGGPGGPVLHPGTLARAWEPSCYWTHTSVLAGLGLAPGPWSFRSSHPDPLPALSWAFRPRGRRDWEAERSPRSWAPIAAGLAFQHNSCRLSRAGVGTPLSCGLENRPALCAESCVR